MNKSQAVESIIKLTAACLQAIDEKSWHPEIKAAVKEDFIKEIHNKSIEAVEQNKFQHIQNQSKKQKV